MTTPETEEQKMNMLFPILWQAMDELGTDATMATKNIIEIGKKVADGTATTEDISYWTMLKATHDLFILKGYVHPFTKEVNMYLRDRMRKDVAKVQTYKQTMKQFENQAEQHPENITKILESIKSVHNNEIEKHKDFAVKREMSTIFNSTYKRIGKLIDPAQVEAERIKRMGDKKQAYDILEDKYGAVLNGDKTEVNPEWMPYLLNADGEPSALMIWLQEQEMYNNMTPEQQKEAFKVK